MDEKVESVKILTEKPMLNKSVTLFLHCVSNDGKYWVSPSLSIHAHDQDTFHYRYVVKYKEGLSTRLYNAIVGGKSEKIAQETKARKLNFGVHQYDIFHNPNEMNDNWKKKIFLGHIYFVKMLYKMLGDGRDLKETLIECEHVGFGHGSYSEESINAFIQWVVEITDKRPTPSQGVYICSLLGQFVNGVRSYSAWRTCYLLGQKAVDQLLYSLGCCSEKALPKSSIKFMKNVAEDLSKAGTSTGFLSFIRVFSNLLDVDYVMQVADKFSSQRYTEQQFNQQVPNVIRCLTRLKDIDSCRRFCCYIIDHSPSIQCLWHLYHTIWNLLPKLLESLEEAFSGFYCKFIARKRTIKLDLLQPLFWNQAPETLKEKLADHFCKALSEEIASEPTWLPEKLRSLKIIALDATLQSADQFGRFVLTVATHKSIEVASTILVLLETKAFCTYWSTSISHEDKKKVCSHWLRINYSSGRKSKERILDVVEAFESLCATDALKTNSELCLAMNKELQSLVLKSTFQSIMEAVKASQSRAPAIQQRITDLLKLAIKQQSGTGDRRARYRQMIHLLGYDASEERKKADLQKMNLDR